MIGNVVNAVGGPVLDKISNAGIDYTINLCKYITTYEKKRKELHAELDKLKKIKNQKMEVVERKGVEDGEGITVEAKDWVQKVEELNDDDDLKIIVTMTDETSREKDKWCGGLCRGNLCHRYKCGKIAYEKLQQIKDLYKDEPDNDKLTTTISGEHVRELIAKKKEHGWKSKEKIIEQLRDKLKDHQVKIIGLYGPKEAGTSQVLREIRRDPQVKTIYNKIVHVKVVDKLNIIDIQRKLAREIIGVKDWTEEGIKEGAKKLETLIRQRREKMLIIIDDVNEKLELALLGTYNNDFCKHLVVSRSKNICRLMEVKEDDALNLITMSDEEAESYFWKTFDEIKQKGGRGDQVTTYAYISLASRMIRKCKGSAQTIATLAKVLADKDITKWKKLDAELQDKDDAGDIIVQKIFEDSAYAKEKFSALACLLPEESSVPILELMRYAIGLDLIKEVDNLSQAMEKAEEWVQDMISSSLLEEDEDEIQWTGGLGHVILYHDARNSIIKSQHEEGKGKYMLETIRRWVQLDENSRQDIESYTAISLASVHDHSCINEQKFNNLEILILDNSKPKDKFSDNFFQGMTTLKVLVLKGMEFQQHSPTSLGKLINLTTLHLEGCNLGDISWIGNLTKLVILSLRGSTVKKIPSDVMRKLLLLRVLDLTKCIIDDDGRIPANILSNLSHLEGLYVYDISCEKNWAECSRDDSPLSENKLSDYASIDELNLLDQLNVLEIKIRNLHQLPHNNKFVTQLKHFYIFIGKKAEPPPKTAKGYTRVLRFGSIEARSQAKYTCLQALLTKTECLSLEEMEDQPHFVQDSTQLEKDKKPEVADFPSLRSLEIDSCHDMEGFAAIPIQAPNLERLEVVKCSIMSYIFKERSRGKDEFPSLREMTLKKLDKLGSVSSTEGTTSGDSQVPALFNKKVTFPALEELTLYKCAQVMTLWDASFVDSKYLATWKNLNKVVISDCLRLQSLGSLSIAAALENLTTLEIRNSPLIAEVISVEENLTPIIVGQIFPKLQRVDLDKCQNMKSFIQSNKYHQELELPSLEVIRIQECPKMTTFSTSSIKIPKLRQLTVEPCYHEEDEIRDVNNFLKERNKQRDPDESSTMDGTETQKKSKKAKAIWFCIGEPSEPNDATNKSKGKTHQGND